MTTQALYESRLKTVRLYGPMGARFGREFELAVSSPADAIRALCAQIDGFKKYLMDSKSAGLTFAVFIGKRNVDKDGLGDLAGAEDIRIAPIIEGSKRGGVLQTIVGAVLVVVGAVFTYFGGGIVGIPMMKMGVAMMIGGVVQMLSPQQKGIGAKDDPDNQPSYSMDGAVNTQAQGVPVQACYGGPLIIGSAVISGGMFAEDML